MKQKKENNKDQKLMELKAGKQLTEKMTDAKASSLKNGKMDKPLARLPKRKDTDHQIRMKWDVTTVPVAIKGQ